MMIIDDVIAYHLDIVTSKVKIRLRISVSNFAVPNEAHWFCRLVVWLIRVNVASESAPFCRLTCQQNEQEIS